MPPAWPLRYLRAQRWIRWPSSPRGRRRWPTAAARITVHGAPAICACSAAPATPRVPVPIASRRPCAILPPAVRNRSDDVRGIHHDSRTHGEQRAQRRPRRSEAGVQRSRIDLIDRHPFQGDALRVADHRLERNPHIGDDGRVRPDPQVENAREPGSHRPVRDACLLLSFADGSGDRALPLVQRASRQPPGAPEVAPRDAMLQQDPPGRIVGEKTGSAEAAPVLLPRLRDHPGIAGIPRPLRATRFTGGRRYDSHPLSLSQHRGHGTTARHAPEQISADASRAPAC